MKRLVIGCAAVFALAAFLFSPAFISAAAPAASDRTEILWDRFGVAHIFATSREEMFYAHGWAQMEAQANLLLHLYGESRGRAAEYWGGDANASLDRWLVIERHARPRKDLVRGSGSDLPQLHGPVRARHQRLCQSAPRLDQRRESRRAAGVGRGRGRARAPCRALRIYGFRGADAARAEGVAARRGSAAAGLRGGGTHARLKYLDDRSASLGQRQCDAADQSTPGLGQHLLPLHGSARRRSQLRSLRRPADRIPRRRRRLQPARRLGPHRQHHRHRGLLQADREGRRVPL